MTQKQNKQNKQNKKNESNNYIMGGLILIGGLFIFSRKNKDNSYLTNLNGKTWTFSSKWLESGDNNTPGSINLKIKSSASKFSNIYTLSPNGPNDTWGTFVINGANLIIAKNDIKTAEIIVGPDGWKSVSIQFKDSIAGAPITLPTLTYTLKEISKGISSGFITNAGNLTVTQNGAQKKYLINGNGELYLD